MAHDMSIHTHEIGDVLTGYEFRDYLQAWECTPLSPNSDPHLFICMKEVNGYEECWRVTGHKIDGEITQVTRTQ